MSSWEVAFLSNDCAKSSGRGAAASPWGPPMSCGGSRSYATGLPIDRECSLWLPITGLWW